MTVLLAPNAIRARRRPSAVFYVWAWQLACAWLVATPLHAWAKNAWGSHPDGDAELFRPGAHALLTWLGGSHAELAIVLKTSLLLVAVSGIVGQVVLGAVIASLATADDDRSPPASFVLGAGVASFAPVVIVGSLAALFEAFVLGAGVLTGALVSDSLKVSLGDARAFTIQVVVIGVSSVLVLAVGVVGDLARVTAAHDTTRLRLEGERAPLFALVRSSTIAALRTARAAFGRAALAWGWRAVIATALLGVAAWAGDLAGARALWALFALHQVILAARAALRVSWLASALRLTSAPPPPAT